VLIKYVLCALHLVLGDLDAVLNRKMLVRLLDMHQVLSDQAENGLIAVNAIKTHGVEHYDLIFMDFTMPVMVSFLLACMIYCVMRTQLTKHVTLHTK
jgi:CheY-like chemotaxis protein